MITLTINGSSETLDTGTTIGQLLLARSVDIERVVVERNREILQKSTMAGTVLCEGDTLEIVRFVGGG